MSDLRQDRRLPEVQTIDVDRDGDLDVYAYSCAFVDVDLFDANVTVIASRGSKS